MIPAHPDAILLDYGGTVARFHRPVESLERAHARVAECLKAAGHRAPSAGVLLRQVHDRVDAEVAASAGERLEEIDVAALERAAFADLGLDVDAATLVRCSAIVQEAWWDGITLHDDAPRALAALRSRGLRVALCSNAPYRAASMHAQLRHLGVDRLVSAAVFSSEVGWRKPSPRIYRAALEAIAAEAERAVMVGDQVREDVDGPAALGMGTMLVVRDGTAAPVGSERADVVVTTLDGVVRQLDSRA